MTPEAQSQVERPARFAPHLGRYLLPGVLSAVALWAPWCVYFITVEGWPLGLLEVMALVVSPAIGPFVALASAVYDSLPEWLAVAVEFIFETTVEMSESGTILLWLFPVFAILWAMTIIGARGKWALAFTVAIGLAFEIGCVVLWHEVV